MSTQLHLGFATGGYAGQISAALAVLEEFAERKGSVRCTFLGPGQSQDFYQARQLGHSYLKIPAMPAPGGPLETFRFLSENVAGYYASRWILAQQQISLLIAVAGYGSAAVVRGALARGIPTILLEPNVTPCATTRWFARAASVVCSGYEQVESRLPVGINLHATGNPVDARITAAAKRPRIENSPRLLVLGGRAGACVLNRETPRALAKIREHIAAWQVIHQAGDGQVSAVQEAYTRAGVEALVLAQLDDRAGLLANSDLVVCRGSAFVLAELAVLGLPAVVLPNPDCPGDHQTANTQLLEQAGGVRRIDEDAAGDRLAAELALALDPLLNDTQQRAAMSKAIRKFARPDAARDIAGLAAELVGGRARAA